MEVQIGERERRPKLQPRRSNRVPRAPIDNNRCSNDFGAGLSQCIDRVQHATARSRCVLDGEHPTPCYVWALDPPLQTVCLSLLAYDEGVQRPASLVRRVQYRCGHRIGAQRESADRVEVPIIDEIKHDLADERSPGVVQREPAQVDVETRLCARREHHPTPHNGEIMDEFTQVVALRHVD